MLRAVFLPYISAMDMGLCLADGGSPWPPLPPKLIDLLNVLTVSRPQADCFCCSEPRKKMVPHLQNFTVSKTALFSYFGKYTQLFSVITKDASRPMFTLVRSQGQRVAYQRAHLKKKKIAVQMFRHHE